MCITQHIHRCLNNLWYISLYVTQGLSSKLHIGMRLHLNGLLRVTWFWMVWLSGESFVTNNSIHTDVSHYISFYVTQGLSSKLHIGTRHHPNGLLRVTWFWRVWLSGESFVTNNSIHTDVSITTFHSMWHKVCPVSFTLVRDITPMVFWGSRDSEGCGYQVSRLLLIMIYILTWVSLHYIVCDTRFVQ